MKKNKFILLSIIFYLLIIACKSNENDENNNDLIRYQSIGASVAEKIWTEDEYDCSNFSVQFYQNCINAGLPCRIRIGSGYGANGDLNHAWNSVWINGKWVDWEPQENNIRYDHKKTSTSIGLQWGDYTEEEILRIMYELIGRNVPKNIIDNYEIDMHLYKNSPFSQYFPGLRINTDITLPPYNMSEVQANIPNNGDSTFYITFSNMIVHWFYKYNDNYYVITNIRSLDSVTGRSIIDIENIDFSKNGDFLTIDSSRWPRK